MALTPERMAQQARSAILSMAQGASQWMARVEDSQRGEKTKRSRTDGPEPAAAVVQCPFKPNESAWLQSTLSGLAVSCDTRFKLVETVAESAYNKAESAEDKGDRALANGSALSARFAMLEEEVERVKHENVIIKNEMEAMQHEHGEVRRIASEEREKLKSDMEKTVEVAVTQQYKENATRTPTPVQMISAGSGDIPWELPTNAIIGYIGWDTCGADLVKYASTLLSELDVKAEQWYALRAITNKEDKGSMCAVSFTSAEVLKRAKCSCHRAQKRGLTGKIVWIDAAKTRTERRPARVVKRALPLLIDAESEKEEGNRLQLTEDVAAKQIKCAQGMVMYTYHGEVKWTKLAENRYARHDRDYIKAYAEST